MVLKDLVFDYSYNDAQMAHVLKPTNKELDQLLAKNVFVLDFLIAVVSPVVWLLYISRLLGKFFKRSK